MSLQISNRVTIGVTLSTPTTITGTGSVYGYGAVPAIESGGPAGTLTNDGTIRASLFAVSFANAGYLTNGAGAGIFGAAAVEIAGFGSILNAGVIDGIEVGIALGTAAVTNTASGVIIGGTNFGAGTLLNEGTISKAIGDIVNFSHGGTVLNMGTAAHITGGAVIGIAIGGAPAYVLNQGQITGVALMEGGRVINQGLITNGSASSGLEITGTPAYVQNTGSIVGIDLTDGGEVENIHGVITGYSDGIDLTNGGTVINDATIFGVGGFAGQHLHGSAGRTGISIAGGGTIDNATAGSLIDGTKYGIQLAGAGAVMITNHGTIEGKYGIQQFGAGDTTIINYGVITGFSGTAISFGNGNDVLVMEAGSQLNGVIENLGTAADTIDLAATPYDPGGTAVLTINNVLDIVEWGTLTTLQLDPGENFSTDYFHLSSDGMNGTDVVESTVPCFLAGTGIATPSGETAVEHLRIGDLVLTPAGAAKSVKWIGRRSYRAPLPDNPDIIPVLIKAGALADNVPASDLYISPAHAVLIDGVLVPAGALINGVSVLSCVDMAEVWYFHVELEHHETIIANGTPAETFIDHDSRRMFDNAAEYYQLYPQSLLASIILCAPRLEFGGELERVRRKVALRAGLLTDQTNGSEIVGFVEFADRQTITGWAFAAARPNVPVSLEILNRGALLARTIANIPRPDVKIAGFGNGRCGFSITLPAPLPALQRHEISVRAAGDMATLAGSPTIIDPAIAQELLQSGGLQTLLETAMKGLTPADIARLGGIVESTGRQLLKQSGSKTKQIKMSSQGKPQPVILVINETWPTVSLDAGSQAIMSHVTAFCQLGYRVVFCAMSGAPQTHEAHNGFNALQSLQVACHGHDGTPAETTIRMLAEGELDFVYVHRLATATAYGGLVRQYAPKAKIIYSVADLHHLRLARQAQITGRPDLAQKANAVRATEFWAMRMADCVLTHSRFEAEYLRREAPRMNVWVVPWAASQRPVPRQIRNHIGFIGGAGHAPNLDAVTHLGQDIMPLVWQRDPSIRCFIAGPGWPQHFFRNFDERIVNLGHQQDLQSLLSMIRLTVAPLRFGAGIKGKILESMAAGTPCVMSSIAAEGLPLDPQQEAIVGNDAAFADNILKVYANKKLARILAQSGLDMVATAFTQEATTAALRSALSGHVAAPDWAEAAALAAGNLLTA